MGVRAVLDQEDPLGAAELGDPLDLEGEVAADVHEERGLGLCSRTLRSKSSNDMQRSSRLQSTNSTCAPARGSRAASP